MSATSGAGSPPFDDLLRAVSWRIKARNPAHGREFARSTGLTGDHPGPAVRRYSRHCAGAQRLKRDRSRPAHIADSALRAATIWGLRPDSAVLRPACPRRKSAGYTASRFSFNTTAAAAPPARVRAPSGWKWRSCPTPISVRRLRRPPLCRDLADIAGRKEHWPGAPAHVRGSRRILRLPCKLGKCAG